MTRQPVTTCRCIGTRSDPGELNQNLGQYECAAVVTANGFVDRPCTDPKDYFVAGVGSGNSLATDVEGNYHNPIHGYIGGASGSAATTAGTMVFWVFHTHVSTNMLANWRHSQKRDMPAPATVPVDLDVRPDNNSNTANPRSRGVIPVAILGTLTFDATDVEVCLTGETLGGRPSWVVTASRRCHDSRRSVMGFVIQPPSGGRMPLAPSRRILRERPHWVGSGHTFRV